MVDSENDAKKIARSRTSPFPNEHSITEDCRGSSHNQIQAPSLAQKLGVEASHVAFIENGRRKPSLKLVARLADILGFDRQNLLLLAHPEAKELITESKPEARPHSAPSWRKFIQNHELLARYNVTDRELHALENLSLLGTVRSAKEFLAILTLIRDVPSK